MSLGKIELEAGRFSANIVTLPKTRRQILCEKLEKIFHIDIGRINIVVEKINKRHKMRK